MTKVPGSVQIDSIMYRGSNSESAAASSFFPDSVSPIFLFPVWRKMAVGGRFFGENSLSTADGRGHGEHFSFSNSPIARCLIALIHGKMPPIA